MVLWWKNSEKNDEFEGLNLSKAKALTFPRAKVYSFTIVVLSFYDFIRKLKGYLICYSARIRSCMKLSLLKILHWAFPMTVYLLFEISIPAVYTKFLVIYSFISCTSVISICFPFTWHFLLLGNGGEILLSGPRFCIVSFKLRVQSVKINTLLVPDTYLLNFQKQRTLSSEKDAVKDHQLQEYIEKQNAYFKEIDEFELEVESGDE